MNKKLVCKVCGKEYDGCIYCLSQKDRFSWRNVACSLEHAAAYLTLVDYERNVIDKKKAKEQLERLLNSGEITLKDLTNVNRILAEKILKEDVIVNKEVTSTISGKTLNKDSEVLKTSKTPKKTKK